MIRILIFGGLLSFLVGMIRDERAFSLTSLKCKALYCSSIRVLGCLIFSKVHPGSE